MPDFMDKTDKQEATRRITKIGVMQPDRRRFMLRRHLAAVLLVGTLAVPAAADDGSRYSEWRPDDAGSAGPEALDALVQDLEALIDEADRARAADPRFLQDLRDTIAAHAAGAEPRAALFRDDFGDGDYTDDPGWTVVSGDFSVDPRLGLHTVVPLARTEARKSGDVLDSLMDTGSSFLDSGKDALGDLLSGEKELGDLLDSGSRKANEDTAPAEPALAEIMLAADIPNAFLLEIEMTSRIAHEDARLEIDLHQRGADYAGYRLSYLPGSDPALVLSRFGRRGVVAIGEHSDRLALEDGHSHRIALRRGGDGVMTVAVDGTELVRVRSSAVEDPFDGVSLVNSGGDYAIRSVAVYGDR